MTKGENHITLIAVSGDNSLENSAVHEDIKSQTAAFASYFCAEAQRTHHYFAHDWLAGQADKKPSILTDGGQKIDTYDLFLISSQMGASFGAPAPYHYVVWTDAEPGWDDALDDWYDQEHLPGLASVPGTVAARRYRCEGPGPRSFACYDLISPDIMGSAAWLAVRGTAWSGKVRPHFTNTRRMMFTAMPADATMTGI